MFINKNNDDNVQSNRVRRLFKLWLSWIIVYFPLGLLSLHGDSTLKIIKKILWGGVGSSVFYSGSWYLIATIFGLIMVRLLKNKPKLLLAIVFSVWILDLVFTNYDFIVKNKVLEQVIADFNPHSTIITGVFWIGVSYYIVKYEDKITNFCNFKLVLFGLLLTNIEFYIVQKYQFSSAYHDMYITLPFAVVSLFIYLLNTPKYIEKEKIKNISSLATLIFFSHFGCLRLIKYFFTINNGYIYFTITLISSVIISTIILELSKYKYLKFLKVLY